VCFGGLVIEALSGLDMIYLFAQVEVELSADEIAEFLSVVRFVLLESAVGRNCHKERLHLIFLGGGHDPLDAVALFVDFLKIFVLRKNDFFVFVAEEFRRCGPQAFNEVKQGDHGGRHLSAFKL
jgi:hypothetical protein